MDSNILVHVLCAVCYVLCVCLLSSSYTLYYTELLSDGVGIAEMRWREIKEINQQEQQVSSEDGTTADELSISPQKVLDAEKDLLSAYNSTVYGLPHLALILPTQ